MGIFILHLNGSLIIIHPCYYYNPIVRQWTESDIARPCNVLGYDLQQVDYTNQTYGNESYYN